jgi:hypothetical protein
VNDRNCVAAVVSGGRIGCRHDGERARCSRAAADIAAVEKVGDRKATTGSEDEDWESGCEELANDRPHADESTESPSGLSVALLVVPKDLRHIHRIQILRIVDRTAGLAAVDSRRDQGLVRSWSVYHES